MRYLIMILLAGGMLTSVSSNQILRSNLEGVGVQGFSTDQPVDGFSVSGPDAEGYVYLVAHSGSQTGQIMRSRWAGSAFQGFQMQEGEFLSGFETDGPDSEGYVYLLAIGSKGSSGAIFKSQLSGIAVRPYSSSSSIGITAFEVAGPDEDGYCYLSVGGAERVADLNQSPEFTLEAIGNPVTSYARINYSIAKSCPVDICIYDPSGRLVNTLVQEDQPSGQHQLVWNGEDNSGHTVNSGVYFVKMKAGNPSSGGFAASRKIVLVK